MMNNYNQFYNNAGNINNYELEKDAYSSFIRGNSFKSLYKQYKNYEPYRIDPQSEKEYDLLLIQIYGFIAHDLGLLLDVKPNNTDIISLRNKYVQLYDQSVMNYEQKYGPLSLDSDFSIANKWFWDSNNFPWEVGK